jgi:hypothetical protein
VPARFEPLEADEEADNALAGFRKTAAAVPQQGKPPITYEWYREFYLLPRLGTPRRPGAVFRRRSTPATA